MVKSRYVEAVQDVVSVMAAYCDLTTLLLCHIHRSFSIKTLIK